MAASMGAVAACIVGNVAPPAVPLAAVLLAAGIGAGAVALRSGRRAGPVWALVGLSLGGAACGLAPRGPEGGGRTPVRFELRVRDGWQRRQWGWRARVRVLAAESAGTAVRVPGELWMELGGAGDPAALPRAGSRWSGSGELVWRSGRPLAAPLLSVKSALLLHSTGPPRGLDAWRDRLAARLGAAAAGDAGLERAAAVAAALALGRREALDPGDVDVMRAGGLAHLLAVSGLHVGIVGGAAWLVLLVAGVSPRGRRWAVAAVVLAFALLSGGAPPVQRAAGAAALVLLARQIGRPLAPLPTVWGVVAALALLDPGAVLGPSLALSATVTLALVRWVGPVAARLSLLPRWLGGAVAVAGTAQAASLPLVGGYFGSVPWLAVLANLLIAPVSVVMVGLSVAATAVAACAGDAARPLLVALGWATTAVAAVAGQAASATSAMAPVPWPAAAVGVVLALVALSRVRLSAPAALLIIGATVAWVVLPPRWPAPRWEVRALQVRDGMAMLVRADRSGVLFDAGRGRRDAARSLALQPIRRLAALVITHADQDHVGGAETVLRQYRVGRLVFPAALAGAPALTALRRVADREGVPATAVARGQSITVGGGRLDVLWPPVDVRGLSDNDASLVARLRQGGVTLLVTGDIESRGERMLMRRGGPLRADVLQVPHHGSGTSSTRVFLDRVRPRVALVACGVEPRFRYPARDVAERLRRQRCVVASQSAGVSGVTWSDGRSVEVRTRRPVTVRLGRERHER